MGTRSTIGIVNADKTITAIYCHWDGYPDHHVPILTECYPTEEKVRALLSLGSLSSLAREIGEQHSFASPHNGWCVAYGRDRGERETGASAYADEASFVAEGEGYIYLFKDGQWLGRRNGADAWVPAASMLVAEEDAS